MQFSSEAFGQKSAGWFLHTSLLLDRIHLAKTWRSQPELNPIQAGFHNVIWAVCGRTQVNMKGGTGGRPVASCQNLGLKNLAHRLASGPDALGQTLTRPPRPRSRPVLHSLIHAFFGKMEPNQMQEVRSGVYSPVRFWLHASPNCDNWP